MTDSVCARGVTSRLPDRSTNRLSRTPGGHGMFGAKLRESFPQHQEGRDVLPDFHRCRLPLCNTQKLPLRPFPWVSARKAEIKQVPAAGARGVAPKCRIPQEWLQGRTRSAFAFLPVRGPHLSHVADSIQASIPAPQPRLLRHARTLAAAGKGGNDLCKVGRGGCRAPGTSRQAGCDAGAIS